MSTSEQAAGSSDVQEGKAAGVSREHLRPAAAFSLGTADGGRNNDNGIIMSQTSGAPWGEQEEQARQAESVHAGSLGEGDSSQVFLQPPCFCSWWSSRCLAKNIVHKSAQLTHGYNIHIRVPT